MKKKQTSKELDKALNFLMNDTRKVDKGLFVKNLTNVFEYQVRRLTEEVEENVHSYIEKEFTRIFNEGYRIGYNKCKEDMEAK